MGLRQDFEKFCILQNSDIKNLVAIASNTQQFSHDNAIKSDMDVIWNIDFDRRLKQAKTLKKDRKTYECPGTSKAAVCRLCPYYFVNRKIVNMQ